MRALHATFYLKILVCTGTRILPRPVFDMASGTIFITRNHTKETSPLFQARRVSEYANPDTIDESTARLPDSISETARAAQPRIVFKRSGGCISD